MYNNKETLTFQDFVNYLHENREIEFSINEEMYFAEPYIVGENKYHYKIWDTNKHACIFQGTLDNLLLFEFPQGYSITENFSYFDFLYIL